MLYHGHVKNGAIVLDDPTTLPEGARVEINVVANSEKPGKRSSTSTLYDRLKPIIGIATGLPTDLAENHDHYLYRRAKRNADE